MESNAFYQLYQDIQPIGKGGTGVIYRAYHQNLGKYVVLKQLKYNGNPSEMRREVDILKNLRHSYLPQVYDFIEVDGCVYTVEEYVEGSDLMTVIQSGRQVPEGLAVRWLRQLCQALDYLHHHRPMILHSDIKPGNIMIDQQGNVCLIDFNISLMHDQDHAVLGYSSFFCAPEQKRQAEAILRGCSPQNIPVDQRTDLYSLAATFYALLSGCTPESNGHNRPLLQMGLDYSEGLLRLLDKTMSIQPEKRVQSARQMLYYLDHLKRLERRYQHYVQYRAALSLTGVVILAGGVLCLMQGVSLEQRERFDQQFQTVCAAYEQVGATETTAQAAEELLEDAAFEGLLNNAPTEQAELISITGEYQYQLDTPAGYQSAAEAYGEALRLISTVTTGGTLLETYTLNYASALAMSGQGNEAEEVVKNSLGLASTDALLVVEAEQAYTEGFYEQVLTIAEQLSAQSASTVKEKVYRTAALAAAALDKWETAVLWEKQVMQLAPSDAVSRSLAAYCVQAATEDNGYLMEAAQAYDALEQPTADDLIAQAGVWYGQCHYQDSLTLLERVTVEQPELECKRLYTIALNQLELNKQNQAKETCQKAIDCYNQLTEKERQSVSRDALEQLRVQLNIGKELLQ